jgi:hypothetical protein
MRSGKPSSDARERLKLVRGSKIAPQTRHSAGQSEAENGGFLRVTEGPFCGRKNTDLATLRKPNHS